MPRFFDSPDEAPAYLSPRRALEYLRQGAVLLDIRESHETNYRAFDVPSAILMPYSVFRERQGEVPRDVPLVVADAVGLRGKEVAKFLLENGYPEVAWIVGGVVDWVREGLPIKTDRNYELRGQCGCKLRPVNAKEMPNRTRTPDPRA
jgi:rhodanese-related sulfurtransferase